MRCTEGLCSKETSEKVGKIRAKLEERQETEEFQAIGVSYQLA